MNSLRPILLADDSEYDVELAMVSLKEEPGIANEVAVVRDGVEALDFLYRRGKFKDRTGKDPLVVLLDLKMPKVNGFEVLKTVKNDARLKRVPVVVLTSSGEERDIAKSYDYGANAYVVKPVDNRQFMATIRQLVLFWADLNNVPE